VRGPLASRSSSVQASSIDAQPKPDMKSLTINPNFE